MEVRLEDRQQQQAQRRLHHPIPDRGNAQRPFSPAALGNQHPSHRTGPVRLGFEFFPQAVEPLLSHFRAGMDGGETLAVHPSVPAVLPLRLQGRVEHVQTQQFPIQTPKPILRLGFSFPIERDLKLPNLDRKSVV